MVNSEVGLDIAEAPSLDGAFELFLTKDSEQGNDKVGSQVVRAVPPVVVSAAQAFRRVLGLEARNVWAVMIEKGLAIVEASDEVTALAAKRTEFEEDASFIKYAAYTRLRMDYSFTHPLVGIGDSKTGTRLSLTPESKTKADEIAGSLGLPRSIVLVMACIAAIAAGSEYVRDDVVRICQSEWGSFQAWGKARETEIQQLIDA